MAGKVIITCALTGSGHTPSMSPYLPYTVGDVIDQGVAAAAAGAAVLHLHARNPEDGSPSADPALFAEYAKGIKERSDVIVSISTGGGTGMNVQERLQGVVELKPELCTLNLGTMNYGSFPMIDRYKGQFKYDWEEPYLESTRAEPFVSTYADIEYMLKVIGPQTGTRFEAEAYDTSHLYTLAYYMDAGARAGAGLRADDLRDDGRHRAGRRPHRAHEAHRGPAARGRVPVVDAGRGPVPDGHRHRRGDHGLARPRRPGGQPLPGQGPDRRVQRQPGHQDQGNPGGPLPGGGDAAEAREMLGLKGLDNVGY